MSQHSANHEITIKLSAPTVFADLNAKEGKDPTYARQEISLQRLKFKHFKEMNKIPQERQMIYAIAALTGLSDDDIDELYAEDAGEITKQIVGFMQSFVDVAKNVMAAPQGR